MNSIPVIIKLTQCDQAIYVNVNHIITIESNNDFASDLLTSLTLTDCSIINVFESQEEIIEMIDEKIKSLRDLHFK